MSKGTNPDKPRQTKTMRQKYKSSRYGLASPLGFRTLRQIRESEKREKKTMSADLQKKLIEDARKSKP